MPSEELIACTLVKEKGGSALILLPFAILLGKGAAIMQRWEYLRLSSRVVTDDKLNALGDVGWELVTVVVGEMEAYFFFKRPKK